MDQKIQSQPVIEDALASEWPAGGAPRESFTIPGGPFRPPVGGGRSYSFTRDEDARDPVPATPEPRTDSVPFAPQPWYANVSRENLEQEAELGSEAEERPPAVPSASVKSQAPTPQQSYVQAIPNPDGSGATYTIQIPSPVRRPARKRSLWWVPLALIGALLLGLLGGALGYRAVTRKEGQSSDPGKNPAPEIFAKYADSVVDITAAGQTTDAWGQQVATTSTGTGFLISEDGYLLTNYHVVRSAETITVSLRSGQAMTARLVAGEDQTSDLALLKLEATGLTPVELGNSDNLRVGDQVFTIGNPLGELSYSLAAGYISAGARRISANGTSITMLQTDAAINRGNSGGPLFDTEGKVIAVVTAKYAGSGEADPTVEGLGFAIPINDAMALAKAWMAGDH